MAQLLVRNLDEDLVRRLEIRAAERGRSAEEEHREILKAALSPGPSGFKELPLAIPAVGDDADFERVVDRGRKVAL